LGRIIRWVGAISCEVESGLGYVLTGKGKGPRIGKKKTRIAQASSGKQIAEIEKNFNSASPPFKHRSASFPKGKETEQNRR